MVEYECCILGITVQVCYQAPDARMIKMAKITDCNPVSSGSNPDTRSIYLILSLLIYNIRTKDNKMKNTLRITAVAIIFGFAAITVNAEKFDPVAYEANIQLADKSLKKNMDRTLKQCKMFAKMGKEYRTYLDESGRDDDVSQEIIKACQARIKEFCGDITSSQKGK